jgi:3-hydroxyacyl-CoA dehydrogenase
MSNTIKQIKHVTVIGGGLMGSGIVQICSQAGYMVTMCDRNQKQLDGGLAIIKKSLTRVAMKKYENDMVGRDSFMESIQSRINTSTQVDKTVEKTDLVIEAIVENLKVKQDLFSSLDKIAKKDCIFTSNTSSLPIGEIAKFTERKSRFAGLHFFNPVPQMKLVEIVKTNDTDGQVFDILKEFTKSVGKVAVSCKDTPGYVAIAGNGIFRSNNADHHFKSI